MSTPAASGRRTSPDNIDLPRVTAICGEVRAFLEPRWAAWQEQRLGRVLAPASTNMCRFTAGFSQKLLTKLVGGRWEVRGGEPSIAGEGGFLDGLGEWRGHYWLLHKGRIVDLTADQFGCAPILITSTDDPRYLSNYDPLEIRNHLDAVAIRSRAWLDEWIALHGEPRLHRTSTPMEGQAPTTPGV